MMQLHSFYSRVSRSIILQVFFVGILVFFPMSRQSFAQNDKDDLLKNYVNRILTNQSFAKYNQNPSISLINGSIESDKSYIKSVSDAFLWSSGIKTQLLLDKRGILNVIYLESFERIAQLALPENEMDIFYRKNFSLIRKGGPCTSLKLNNSPSNKDLVMLFVDKNSDNAERATCIYRHYRALFGISEYENMPDWSDTFVTDLRMLKCRSRYSSPKSMDEAFRAGMC